MAMDFTLAQPRSPAFSYEYVLTTRPGHFLLRVIKINAFSGRAKLVLK